MFYDPRVMKNQITRKFLFCLAATAAGWIAAFSMPPASVWPCLFIGLSALYVLYSKTEKAAHAFAAGFFFAIGYFVTGLWWIGNALLVEGNDFAWVWPISVIGLPTLLALFTGTYLACARMLSNPLKVSGFLAFAFFLTFSEWARGNAFTGFPWNLYGYVWADHLPMAQMARFTGAYGMTLLSVIWASLAGFLYLWKKDAKAKAAFATVAILMMTAIFFLGKDRLDSHEIALNKRTGLVVVQPNIPQDMKWDPVEAQNNFLKIISLSKAGLFTDPQPENIFIVWPETAISPSIYTVPSNIDMIQDVLRGYNKTSPYLVTGILRREDKEDGPVFANSVTLMDKEALPLRVYDKYHLVPFGEFIPLQDWIPLKPVAAFRGFTRGAGPETIAYKNLPPFSPLICYEIIFPDVVTDRHGERPEWLVNVTNDGWYGNSAGPYQHFAQTRLRAIEEGLPVIRSANTGISGIIDPYGRVIERAEFFQEAALVNYLPHPLPGNAPAFPWTFQIFLPVCAIFLLLRILVIRKD